MIKFILPDSQIVRDLNFWMLSKMKTNPKWFLDDFVIDGVYGIIKPCIFAGGRVMTEKLPYTCENIDYIMEKYESFGIQYRLTYTNLFVNEEHKNDWWSLEQLRICEKHHGAAIVATDFMYNLVKKECPNIELVASVTRGLLTDKEREELFENPDYKLVVVNTFLNDKLEEKIPEKYRKKTEILINDCCPATCPRHQHCYEMNSTFFVKQDDDYGCKNKNRIITPSVYEEYEWMKKNCSQIPSEEVRKLNKAGFDSMKMNGRNTCIGLMVLYYADYLIKPEFRRDFIWEAIFENADGFFE